jgi:transposase
MYKFGETFFGRQPQPLPRPKSVVELLGIPSITSTATSERRPKPDPALGRYLDAQRARETQAALADRFAGEYARALEGANSEERHAAAVMVAEAYDEARSLTQIELDLMVAAKVIRIPGCTEREMDIQDSIEGYVQAAVHWRQVAEKSRIQALNRFQPVLPMMPGAPERRSHDYVHPGTTSLFADLDMVGGKVIGSLRQRHRAQEFKKFLVQIDTEVPADLDVHLILDNYATHKTPEIRCWLLLHPRFHLHFMPTSGSWLNMVERWFAERTTKKIKHGAHTSVKALEKDIRDWIKTWNDDPRPHVWVKTADQILASLARY